MSLTVILLNAGIVLIPFFVLPGFDSRVPKETLGMGLALSCIVFNLYSGGLKPFKNFWMLLFLLFGYVCILLAPKFSGYVLAHIQNKETIEILTQVSVDRMWMFKALYYITVYFLMIMTVSSLDVDIFDVRKILLLMALVSFLMSLYIFIQYFGLDQFFSKVSESFNSHVNNVPRNNIGGTMGQPTVVAPFIAMSIPLFIYLRKYSAGACCVVAVILTASKVAVASMILGLLFYLLFFRWKYRYATFSVVLAVLITVCSYAMKEKSIFYPDQIIKYASSESSGRTGQWGLILNDFKNDKRAVTGIGPGSFPYIHQTRHKDGWGYAHNDPMELLRNFGIMGFLIIGFAILTMVMNLNYSGTVLAIGSSFLILCLTSFGAFSLQMAPNIFYACILVGLLHNKLFTKEETWLPKMI